VAIGRGALWPRRFFPETEGETMTQMLAAVIRPEDLAGLLEESAAVRLLDVRTPGEYETAHIRGAYNVPLDRLGEHGPELRAAVSEPVVLVCQSGQRARKAEEALKTAGMPNLHVLDGGMNGWTGAGQPVIRGAARISLERQVRIAAGAMAATGAALALLVNPLFALIPLFMGSGLVFAGVTDICGLGLLLARLPYNRPASCDVGAMVQALISGAPPRGIGRLNSTRTADGPVCA
jgi:rhodanese-related sulfurtransferase